MVNRCLQSLPLLLFVSLGWFASFKIPYYRAFFWILVSTYALDAFLFFYYKKNDHLNKSFKDQMMFLIRMVLWGGVVVSDYLNTGVFFLKGGV